jgi:hypothetical protein
VRLPCAVAHASDAPPWPLVTTAAQPLVDGVMSESVHTCDLDLNSLFSGILCISSAFVLDTNAAQPIAATGHGAGASPRSPFHVEDATVLFDPPQKVQAQELLTITSSYETQPGGSVGYNYGSL